MACDLSLSASQATTVHATLTLGTYRMYVRRYFLTIYDKLMKLLIDNKKLFIKLIINKNVRLNTPF